MGEIELSLMKEVELSLMGEIELSFCGIKGPEVLILKQWEAR